LVLSLILYTGQVIKTKHPVEMWFYMFFFISITFISIPRLIFGVKLSIMPSLNLRHELNFIFEFNQFNIELYSFINETNAIFPFT